MHVFTFDFCFIYSTDRRSSTSLFMRAEEEASVLSFDPVLMFSLLPLITKTVHRADMKMSRKKKGK